MGNKTAYWTALVLVLIGGLNWGLIGLFDYDLVASLFGDMSAFSRFIYILVGLSAVYLPFAVGMKEGTSGRTTPTPTHRPHGA